MKPSGCTVLTITTADTTSLILTTEYKKNKMLIANQNGIFIFKVEEINISKMGFT